MIRLPDLSMLPTSDDLLGGGGGDGRVRLLVDATGAKPRVLLPVDRRLYLSGRKGWRQILELENGSYVYDLVSMPGPDGRTRSV